MTMTNIINTFRGFERSKQTKLIVAFGVIFIAAALAFWWLMSPSYQPIISKLKVADAAEVVKALDENKIPHRFSSDGETIEVPSDMIYDARMKLVTSGVPSGGHVGFELFNSTDFGATEFAQRINYQRAVQGELERSIATLPGVSNVRVHLTIRKKGLFVSQDDASKASVTITMLPGEQLNSRQVNGIKNLVASAVDGLVPNSVVVLGPNGILPGGSQGIGEESGFIDSEDLIGYESRVRDRIKELLNLILDVETFRVSVNATLNQDKVKTVSEKILPGESSGNGFVTKKRVSQSNKIDTQNSGNNSQSQEEYDYIYGKVLEEVSKSPGRIERLSVAVIVPDTVQLADIEKIKRVVSTAAGIDLNRGDQIEVVTISKILAQSAVDSNEIDQSILPEAFFSKSSWFNVQSIVVLIFGLVFGVLLTLLLSSSDGKKLSAEEQIAMREKITAWLAETRSES